MAFVPGRERVTAPVTAARTTGMHAQHLLSLVLTLRHSHADAASSRHSKQHVAFVDAVDPATGCTARRRCSGLNT